MGTLGLEMPGLRTLWGQGRYWGWGCCGVRDGVGLGTPELGTVLGLGTTLRLGKVWELEALWAGGHYWA